MRALVVYESMWGNTEEIARAISNELAKRMPVDTVDSDWAPGSVDDYELLVVGGPTHAFSMSRPATRSEAVDKRGALRGQRRGIREWLEQLTPSENSTLAATFDTRVDSPRLPGSAAKAAMHELRSLGFDTPMDGETFRVHGYEGPLVDGETERATLWAHNLLVGELSAVAVAASVG